MTPEQKSPMTEKELIELIKDYGETYRVYGEDWPRTTERLEYIKQRLSMLCAELERWNELEKEWLIIRDGLDYCRGNGCEDLDENSTDRDKLEAKLKTDALHLELLMKLNALIEGSKPQGERSEATTPTETKPQGE